MITSKPNAALKKAAARYTRTVEDNRTLASMAGTIDCMNGEIHALKEQLNDERGLLRCANEQLGDLKQQFVTKGFDIARLSKKNDEVEAESNELRRQLFESLQENARLMGYIEGQVDMRPVDMLPQPVEREHPLAKFRDRSATYGYHEHGSSGWRSGQAPKAWFSK